MFAGLAHVFEAHLGVTPFADGVVDAALESGSGGGVRGREA